MKGTAVLSRRIWHNGTLNKKMDGKNIVKKIFNRMGYSVTKNSVVPHPQHTKPLTPKHFFDLFFSLVDPKKFFFIQIGANDGKSRDMMYDYIDKYDLAGILVEPQAEVFEKLKEAHKDHRRIRFANVAISERTEQLDFYTVKKELITPENYFEATAIASFDKDTFMKTLERRIPKVISKISDNLEDNYEIHAIEALSLSDFLNKESVENFDLLFLDCEGIDHKIIKMVDFKKYHPKLIIFESKFLNDAERAECENLLISNGYDLFRHGNDTCAFLA